MIKLGQNPLCDSRALFKVEQFVAELNNIVSIAVHDQSVNCKSNIQDQLPANHLDGLVVVLLLALKLAQLPHHMFDHTHRVLIQGKGQQILSDVVKESDGVLQGERFDDLLDEVGRIVMPAQLIEVPHDFDGDKGILLIEGEIIDKGLDSMRSLFVLGQLAQLRQDQLQDMQPLKWRANGKQFLNHIIAVLVGDKLNQLFSNVSDDFLNFIRCAVGEVVLEQSGLVIVLDKLYQRGCADQFLQVHPLRLHLMRTIGV